MPPRTKESGSLIATFLMSAPLASMAVACLERAEGLLGPSFGGTPYLSSAHCADVNGSSPRTDLGSSQMDDGWRVRRTHPIIQFEVPGFQF